MQFALLNTTTIENLSRHSKVWTLAVFIPSDSLHPTPPPFHMVTYPLGYIGPNQDDARPQVPAAQPRTFAILHSKPGENPWDLGILRNFKSVMGEHWYDWFLPLKYSPCTDHDRYEAQFETGSVVERMREDAGLAPLDGRSDDHRRPERSGRRRRKRRSDDVRGKYERRSRKKRRHSRNRPDEGIDDTELGSMESAV